MDASAPRSACRILIPLDGSEPSNRAITAALTIGGPEATYILLHVLEETIPVRGPWSQTTPAIPIVERDYRRSATSLAAGGVALRRAAPFARLETMMRVGDPARTIVTEARSKRADLIVMISQGRETPAEEEAGSTADRVVRASTVPVLVLRDGAEEELSEPLSRIVVPLDGSRRAGQALPVASHLARTLGVPVRLVTVIDPASSFPPTLAYEAAQTGAFFEEVAARLRYELQTIQDRAVRALRRGGVAADGVLIFGPTVPCIVEQAAPGTLLVMTTHGCGGSGHWLMGSVAEALLRDAHLPIVVVRSRREPDVVTFALDEGLGLKAIGTDTLKEVRS